MMQFNHLHHLDLVIEILRLIRIVGKVKQKRTVFRTALFRCFYLALGIDRVENFDAGDSCVG